MIDKAGSYEKDYRRQIRAAVYGLWRGAIDRNQFWDAMTRAIDIGLGRAFAEGAKQCGIKPEEYSDQELGALRDAQANEALLVLPFADAILEGSKANGGKVSPLYQRADLWILRYRDLVNRGKAMACSDQKFKWVLGPTKEHCGTCDRLNGQVRRGSFWRDHVLPQNAPNRQLECEGWRCLCNLQLTDEPCSRGRLPRVP